MTPGSRKAAGLGAAWKVSYASGRAGRRIVRRFKTEAAARRFYTSLFRRGRPPGEQAIEAEK